MAAWQRRLAAVVLVSLAVAAGCSALPDGGGDRTTYGVPEGSPEPSPSGGSNAQGDRPAEVGGPSRDGTTPDESGPDPPEGRTFAAEELAPGLVAEGVWSVDRLAAAHGSVLENRSFRVRYRRIEGIQDETGELAGREYGARRVVGVVAAVSADRRRYRVRRRVDRAVYGPRDRVVTDYWSAGDGDGTLRLLSFGEARGYERLGPDDFPGDGLPGIGDPTARSLVRGSFGATVAESVEPVPGAVSPARYRVVATGDRTTRLTPDGPPVRNLALRAVVDSRGVVRALELAYDRREGEGWTRMRVEFEFEGVGRTTPEPPEWVEEARRATNESAPRGR